MKGWKEYKIKDVAVNIFSGGTPSTKNACYYKGNIPWLNTKEINFRKINGTLSSISESGLLNSAAKWVPENSVIVAMYGVTAGKVAINAIPLTTNQACCNIVVNNDKFNFKFIYYSLYNSYLELKNLSSGAAQQNLNVNIISNFTISIPDFVEQRAITAVLSNLDDKIDLLQRQNATLEAMAETSFRQSFEITSENKTKLGEVLDISSGKGLKKEAFLENGAYPVLGANGKIGTTNQFLYDGKMIYTGRVGTLGNIYIFNGKAWYSDNTLLFTNTKYFYTVYFLLKFLHLEDYNVGSTQPLIRQSDIKSIDIFLPDKDIMEKFESNAETIFTKIRSNQFQIQTLEKLRDTLLPKLMSGEVRVSLD